MNNAVESSSVKKDPPVEEILLTLPQDDKPHPLRVRLLTYWNGTRDVHFPYGGCTREIIVRIADVLKQRGLQLKDDNGDAWPTGIYFSVSTAAAL